MARCVGLALGAESVRAVEVADERVVWAGEAEIPAEGEIEAAVLSLLQRLPRHRWLRPLVVAAVGMSRAQFKRMAGLPAPGDAAMWTGVVRESPSRFFLQDGVPLVTTPVFAVDGGRPWVAAFEQPAVQALSQAARRAGLELRAVVPSVAVVGWAFVDGSAVWRDGRVVSALRFQDSRLTEVRRLSPGDAAAQEDIPTLVPGLARLGERAGEFADAYGAAVARLAVEGVLRPGFRGADWDWRAPGLAAAAACVFVAGALALAAPGLASMRAAADAEAQLRTLGSAVDTAAATEQVLGRFAGALREADAFAAARVSVTRLLAELARALPSGSAIISLRLAPPGGTVVALAPRGASLPGALERVRGLTQSEMVGPVTREEVGGRDLERVTIRFRLTRSWP